MRSQPPFQVLSPRQFFINFLVVCHIDVLNDLKNLDDPFFVLAKYDLFWHSKKWKTWNFLIRHKTIVHYKIDDWRFTIKVKLFLFDHEKMGCLAKTEKGSSKFFMCSKVCDTLPETVRKVKKCWEKLSHFCHGPKTWKGSL